MDGWFPYYKRLTRFMDAAYKFYLREPIFEVKVFPANFTHETLS